MGSVSVVPGHTREEALQLKKLGRFILLASFLRAISSESISANEPYTNLMLPGLRNWRKG